MTGRGRVRLAWAVFISIRLGALDGTLEVTSAPGDGTRVAGRIPIGAA